jgi:hypothetical protein
MYNKSSNLLACTDKTLWKYHHNLFQLECLNDNCQLKTGQQIMGTNTKSTYLLPRLSDGFSSVNNYSTIWYLCKEALPICVNHLFAQTGVYSHLI